MKERVFKDGRSMLIRKHSPITEKWRKRKENQCENSSVSTAAHILLLNILELEETEDGSLIDFGLYRCTYYKRGGGRSAWKKRYLNGRSGKSIFLILSQVITLFEKNAVSELSPTLSGALVIIEPLF